LGNNFYKGERFADEAAVRLRTYVRNVLYGDISVLADNDMDGRRRSCLSVAHSQLEQDIAAATDISLEHLKQHRSSELNLLMVLASQLLQQRFECERCVERVTIALDGVGKNFGLIQIEEKREPAPLSSNRSYREYLLVEKGKLLNDLAVEVDALRARLELVQGLVSAVRLNSSVFVSAVLNGCPFQLRVVNGSASVAASTDDESLLSQESVESSVSLVSTTVQAAQPPVGCDADVKFWLQSNGLLKYENAFAHLKWASLRLLTVEGLRQMGVGSNDGMRQRIVQLFLKIDCSDWFNGTCRNLYFFVLQL
jgi:hypothetical protein